MSSYDQGYTCIECSHSYDDRDGDLDERMCNECLDKIYEQNKKDEDLPFYKKLSWESPEMDQELNRLIKRDSDTFKDQ